jgi:hypothetical protein
MASALQVVFTYTGCYNKDASWDPSVGRTTFCYRSHDLGLNLEEWHHYTFDRVDWFASCDQPSPLSRPPRDEGRGEAPIVFSRGAWSTSTFHAHRGARLLTLLPKDAKDAKDAKPTLGKWLVKAEDVMHAEEARRYGTPMSLEEASVYGQVITPVTSYALVGGETKRVALQYVAASPHS